MCFLWKLLGFGILCWPGLSVCTQGSPSLFFSSITVRSVKVRLRTWQDLFTSPAHSECILSSHFTVEFVICCVDFTHHLLDHSINISSCLDVWEINY
ncbi:hypothetical protein FKM82_010630 [Ascaphus truei]